MGERILLADDEETFLYATADLLRQGGYECDCVLDGPGAVAKLEERPYALIISDIKMPGNPNLELIRLLPQLAPGVPVILVTGYPTLRSAVQSIQLPVVAYLAKPLDFEELLRQVRAALVQSGVGQALRRIGRQLQEWSQGLQALGCPLPVKPIGFSSAPTPASPLQAEPHQPDYSTLARLLDSGNGTGVPRDEKTTPLRSSRTITHREISSVATADQLHALTELHTLSAREWEILDRLWTHQRVGTIARALFVSPHTVRNHLKSIFRKVGVNCQSELLMLLMQKTAAHNDSREKP
jgi:DNA-binding NarL/FixJ family response regulator